MNNIISIREFTRNIYAYIKRGGDFILTVNGTKKLVVTIDKYSPDVVTIHEGNIEIGVEKHGVIQKTEYSCGCPITKSKLCPKHGRF